MSLLGAACLELFTLVYCGPYLHSGITCLSTYDILGDGIQDILVGRDDGTVQVYGFDETDEPRLKLTHVSPALCFHLCYL